MMVFFIILSIIFLIIVAIMSTKIKFQILKFEANNLLQNKKLEFETVIKIYIFSKILIFKTNINKKKLQNVNPKIKAKISKKMNIKTLKNIINPKKIIKNKNKVKEYLKKLNIKIEQFVLKLQIGTEDVLATTYIIPVIATIIAVFLSKNSENVNYQNVKYEIIPLYKNKNLYDIRFKGIITLKLVHIIYIILVKKKESDKFGDTSYRKFNGNCNV